MLSTLGIKLERNKPWSRRGSSTDSTELGGTGDGKRGSIIEGFDGMEIEIDFSSGRASLAGDTHLLLLQQVIIMMTFSAIKLMFEIQRSTW
jgi:hypothetical protein